ncbi:hypothetical protein L195_g054790, partial [Trifolium pratense]
EGLKPNYVTWTSLLSSHARCGLYDETMEFFKLMRTRGIEISAEAIAVVLSVCADMDRVQWGKEIHGYVIKGGYEDYLFVKNTLIGTYGKKREHLCDAHKIFSDIKNKNLLEKSNGGSSRRPNVISWSAVISGFASKGCFEQSLELFRRMQLAKESHGWQYFGGEWSD